MCKVCDRDNAHEHKMQFWHPDYCSFYYQRFDELKLSKIRPSASKHHNQHLVWPPIPAFCETCGEEFNLAWRPERCNRAFCTQDCNNSPFLRKRSRKHYFPLKVLKHATTPLLASTIAQRIKPNLKYNLNSNSISQLLLIYIKKGIIKVKDTMVSGYPLREYSMTLESKKLPIKSYLI